MQTNLHSQFYKSAPIITIKEPGYSLGTNRATSNQASNQARRKAMEANNEEEHAHTSSSGQTQMPKHLDKTHRPIRTPKPGKKLEEDREHEDKMTLKPTYEGEEIPLRDSGLFYSNGNPESVHAEKQPA